MLWLYYHNFTLFCPIYSPWHVDTMRKSKPKDSIFMQSRIKRLVVGQQGQEQRCTNRAMGHG